MDLMEFEARSLFADGGVPVPDALTVESTDDLTEEKIAALAFPVVVKAQVATGGRGKSGGVKIAQNADELRQAAGTILGMTIRGHAVNKVMVAAKVNIAKEMYLSILLDRNAKKHVMVFSPEGGVEIEQTAKNNPEKIFKLEIDPLFGYSMPDGLYLAEKALLDTPQRKEFATLCGKLYALAKSNDALLAEINPLVLTYDGKLLAVDAKISVDSDAVFRHPKLVEFRDSHRVEPLVKEAAGFRFLYIPCDADGYVVIMSNGSGMLMSCIDHITRNGNKVSAVLDLGGGATADRIEHAVDILYKTPNAKILFINIFGGITRCDEVAGGIRSAVEHGVTRPIVVRFEGTNKVKGLEIIDGLTNVTFADSLHEGEEAVRRLLK